MKRAREATRRAESELLGPLSAERAASSSGRSWSGSPPTPATAGRPAGRTVLSRRLGAERLDRRRLLRLFQPYRWRLGSVLALIGLSAGLGMISPFLLRGVLDEAIPNQDTILLAGSVVGMIAIAIATGALGVAQTLLSNTVGQRVMHDLARPSTATSSGSHWPSSPAPAPVRSSRESPTTSVASRVSSPRTATSIVSNVTTVIAAGDGDVPARLAPGAGRARPPAVLRLADPPRRPGAPPDHRRAPGPARRHLRADRGVALGLGDPARQDLRALRRARRALRPRVGRARRPRGSLADGRSLADGVGSDRVRRDARARSTCSPGSASPAAARDHDRHPGRLHDPPDPALLPDPVAALGQRRRAELAGALRARLRVPRRCRSRSDERPTAPSIPAERRPRRRRIRRGRLSLRADGDWILRGVDLTVPPARPSPWSARRAPARRRSPTCSRASTTPRRARSRSTASTSASSRSRSLAGDRRRRLAGDLPVPCLGTRQPALRAARRRPTREIEAAARAAQIHDLIASPARGLRDDRRRARLPLLGRREAADRDRARDAPQPAGPDPRRGDERARHPDRARRAGGARPPGRGPHGDRDRPPAVDGPPTPSRSRSSTRARVAELGSHEELLELGDRYAAMVDLQSGGQAVLA